MTSFGATKVIKEKGFMPTFKIQGQVYHNIGSLLPQPDSDPKYLQVYFIGDADREAAVRSSHNPSTKAEIVLALQEFFHKNNPYIKELKTNLEKIECDDGKVIIRADKAPKDQHAGRYNAPTVSEIAILLQGEEHLPRDIILHRRSSGLLRVTETHRSYDALQYPIMFWKGEDGYQIKIPQFDQKTGKENPNKTVSSMDFYASRIMIR